MPKAGGDSGGWQDQSPASLQDGLSDQQKVPAAGCSLGLCSCVEHRSWPVPFVPIFHLVTSFSTTSLGNEQMKAENFEAAVSFYGKAIELNPSNAVYFCNRY